MEVTVLTAEVHFSVEDDTNGRDGLRGVGNVTSINNCRVLGVVAVAMGV
jgi:hypothetical protein